MYLENNTIYIFWSHFYKKIIPGLLLFLFYLFVYQRRILYSSLGQEPEDSTPWAVVCLKSEESWQVGFLNPKFLNKLLLLKLASNFKNISLPSNTGSNATSCSCDHQSLQSVKNVLDSTAFTNLQNSTSLPFLEITQINNT